MGPQPHYCAEHIEQQPGGGLQAKCASPWFRAPDDGKACKQVVLREVGFCFRHFDQALAAGRMTLAEARHQLALAEAIAARLERQGREHKQADDVEAYQRKCKLAPKYEDTARQLRAYVRERERAGEAEGPAVQPGPAARMLLGLEPEPTEQGPAAAAAAAAADAAAAAGGMAGSPAMVSSPAGSTVTSPTGKEERPASAVAGLSSSSGSGGAGAGSRHGSPEGAGQQPHQQQQRQQQSSVWAGVPAKGMESPQSLAPMNSGVGITLAPLRI